MTPAVKPFGTPLWRRPVVLILLLACLSVGLFFFLPRARQTKAPLPEVLRSALTLRESRLYRTGESSPFTGFMIERYEEGALKSRSVISNGVLQGVSEGWHTNGVLEVREHFTNGVSHGLREKWSEHGKKISEGTIVAGKLDGPFRRWYENGQVVEEITMKQGEPDGTARSYFPSGYLKTEARLQNGKVLETKSWQDRERKPPMDPAAK
ncbi:MAG: toxin-antitoxin system YwqK family antitoxin [Verrucomicrobiales bacterium]|nr:toxin-antitoxin system YwqK family antitoxin [Verrucomicrobiales bacterium]